MDSFLCYGDYAKQIQADALGQAMNMDATILDGLQNAAISECKSYLKQKYDVSKAFNPIVQHNPTANYNAGQAVYLNAPAYDSTKTYAVGDQRLQAGIVYSCSTPITVREAFNAAHWTALGEQWSIYHARLPYPEFNYRSIYAKGDQVFWKDKTYTAQLPTQILDHQSLLNIGQAGVSDVLNVFPDDPKHGAQYWGAGTAYSVPANTPISNATYWENTDNRDQKLLEICVTIVLYKLHLRIAPRNVPELRMVQYLGYADDRETRGQRILYPTYCALGWLQSAAIGDDITPELPLIQPNQGARIRFGGNQKNINTY